MQPGVVGWGGRTTEGGGAQWGPDELAGISWREKGRHDVWTCEITHVNVPRSMVP